MNFNFFVMFLFMFIGLALGHGIDFEKLREEDRWAREYVSNNILF